MKKKLFFLCLITTLSLVLIACSNNKDNLDSKNTSKSSIETKISMKDDTRIIGGEETGTGKVNLVNESGSTENGNILYVMYQEDMILMPLGLESEGMDGSKPTIIYLDGEVLGQEQLSDSQTSIELRGDALEKGIHNVEFIQKDGENVTFYHIAKYEVK